MNRRFLFPIESGQVLAFARAIGDPDPVFKDPQFGVLAKNGSIVPPPTFLIAAHHFDPESFLRPSPGEAVPGGGHIPIDGPIALSDRPRGLHAEETFTYHRHPRIGEILSVTVLPGQAREKPGRDGRLEFKDVVWEYRDTDEALVATACWTSVYVHGPREKTPAPAAPIASAPSALPPVTPLPPAPIAAGQLRVGDHWTARVVESLRMTHLITYAGASGDLVALHYDERIVKAMGHPGLFGHGMLTMGLSSRLLSAVVGTANLRRLSARMTAVVFPGDSLITSLRVDAILPEQSTVTADFSFTTLNQHGRAVLTGKATATLLDKTAKSSA